MFDGNVADSARDEGLVRARAEAAEEHVGLRLDLQRAAHAGRREARRRPDEGLGGGREGEDELHRSNLLDWQRHDSRCTERDDYFYGE